MSLHLKTLQAVFDTRVCCYYIFIQQTVFSGQLYVWLLQKDKTVKNVTGLSHVARCPPGPSEWARLHSRETTKVYSNSIKQRVKCCLRGP